MSIASEIQRLQTAKSNIQSALVSKGVSDATNHNFDDFANDINNIVTQKESDWQSHWSTTGGGGDYSFGGVNTKWIITTAMYSSISGCSLYCQIPYTHSKQGEQKLYIYKVSSPAQTYRCSTNYVGAYSHTWSIETDLKILTNFKN